MVTFEEKHPRDNDGKFTNKAEAQLQYESDMADTERKTRKWIAESGVRSGAPKAQGFNRPSTKSHLAHAKEMGLNEKQYVKAAEEFFNSDNGDLYYDNRRKCFVKIDEKRLLLCACEKDGSIKTFHKIKKKNISKIIKQDKLEKIWKK